MSFQRLAVLGCGLIGGSFALACREAGLVDHVVGCSRSPASTARAVELGVLNEAAHDAAAAVRGADVVLLAVPVSATETTLRSIREVLEPHALVMDVGSTKRDVVDAARRSLRERVPQFVPAHPIAGKELAGVEHADARLFMNRLAIVTPIASTDAAQLDRAQALWSAVGAHVQTMTPEQHDTAFAAVSHLPHLLAFAYFQAVAGQPAGREFLELAGPGFRDFTRIAAGDPTVWRDILIANRDPVLDQLQRFRRTLEAYEIAMRSGNADALADLVRLASDGRARWQMSGR